MSDAFAGQLVDADKLDTIFRHRKTLAKAEPLAMRYWREPNWANLTPMLICCDGNADLGPVFNYYRFLISSEAQGGFPAGRSSYWMVVDAPTNAFLGLFAYTSFAQSWPYLENYLGWGDYPDLRLAHRKHVQFLARCLPSESFGDLLGGKLLALLSTSREMLSALELRYSLPVAAVAICTLHGQGSQYNRLDKQGIVYLGDDTKGRGTYLCEARKNGLWFLKGDVTDVGDWTRPTLRDTISDWKTRWYEKRLRHKGAPVFDSKQYALGRFL